MKKNALAAACAAAALMAAPSALAQGSGSTGWYAGAGYTHYDLDAVELGGVTGRLGYRFHPNFAVEGEATLGVVEDDIAGIDVELDHAYGVYGIGYLPVSPNVELFGRVGYAEVEAEAGPFNASADGVGYGVGAQMRVAENVGIRGEYTRLEGDEDGADTFGVSAVVGF